MFVRYARPGWALLVFVVVSAPPTAATERDAVDAVGDAIARAVAEQLRSDATVVVTDVQTRVQATGALTASPEPGARTGTAARFVLFASGVRVGTAVARTHVTTVQVRASRAIARGAVIGEEDLDEVEAVLDRQPMRRLPDRYELAGARTRRHVAAGELLDGGAVDIPPLVRAGDQVTAIVRIGAVLAEGRATASGTGHRGDVIRVMSPATRRPVQARIIGPGTVEIMP